jgi:elongation factor P
MDGNLLTVVNIEHIKLARGSAVIKAKLRNILTGAIFEQSFRSGDKYKSVRIESSEATFLYSDADLYHFLDAQTYEEVSVARADLDAAVPYLKEGNAVRLLRYGDRVIGVDLPITVELKVVGADPGVKGDTVSAVTKPARLETGTMVQVPIFVNEGDVIRVDTRSGSYLERV